MEVIMKSVPYSNEEIEFIDEIYRNTDGITYKEIAEIINDTFFDSQPIRKASGISKILKSLYPDLGETEI
jgi:hypothetical protein